ncbi:secretin and TonB N-terminal domain-containing protein [Pedobacter africanus]|uniref:Type II secretion system protein D (GspD) n=1 Tax=Pedobacter africanus TaxID=151894 RepID=A0A1W2EFG7_9SPHI|nr:secretin and TonB N-terminal domain-containing protein [Pedobacter africanus]SMD08405.1 type II secretion system protein D (GspD) [Pedobacter africanus]
MKRILLIIFFCLPLLLAAQQNQQERIDALEKKLVGLSAFVPGLKQKVQLGLSGASIQEFLRAVAQANQLNINVDPMLNIKVSNNFTNENALNVILFLAKNYNLEVNVIGSIITVSPYNPPVIKAPYVPKVIAMKYNAVANTLSMELNNDSLAMVARKVSQLSGKNVVVPVALNAKVVSGFFNEAPLETALEKLAFANELKLTKTSDNVYVFQGLQEGEEVFINADKNTDVRKNLKPSAAGAGGGKGTFNLSGKSVTNDKGAGSAKLLSIDAVNTPIIDLVKSAAAETNVNFFLYSDLKGSISTKVNNITFDNFLTAMFNGTDYTYKVDNGVYLIGDRKLEGLRKNKVLQLQYRAVDTIMNMIPSEWKKGVDIKEFKEQNTLLLSGSGPQLAEIESYVRELDKLVPMVLIEVTMLDIRKGHTTKTGIEAGLADSVVKTRGTVLSGVDMTLGAGSINNLLGKIGTGSVFNIGKVTPNFYVKLNALEANNNIEIRQVPKLATLNGHTANLSIGTTRYYVTKTQNVFSSVNTQTVFTEQFNKVDANLAIGISPVVSGDDQVTLKIKVEISDFIGTPPANAPPPTSTSKFESIIRAHNEDMIVLGGMERSEKSDSGSGVPLLSRIPILKWLFSSREQTKSKVVTLVFIKPTIIYQ